MNIRDILDLYKKDSKTEAIGALLKGSAKLKIHLKGLIGSSDSMMAMACYFLNHQNYLFVLPDREEAAYFMNDLENISEKPILFFPSSYRKEFDFTGVDTANVLLRAEVLQTLREHNAFGSIVVTYPEAICEKVLSIQDLEKNSMEIKVGDTLDLEFLTDFLAEYEFERSDFVYEAGQFSVRGGIIDVFSFSNELPFRIELFGNKIESIRTFQIEDQLSVKNIQAFNLVPNVHAKALSENSVSLLNYFDNNSALWIKDVQFTFDIIEKYLKRSISIFEALPPEDKRDNPQWIHPQYLFDTHKELNSKLSEFTIIEFGKQFYFPSENIFTFDFKPQPSFNKDFNLLIHNLEENSKAGFDNFIFADAAKQVERLYSIFEDIQKQNPGVPSEIKFRPIHLSIREGFIDNELKITCFTDHQIFNRFHKYKLKAGYTKSQALTLKELKELTPGDFITHIDHGIGKFAGLEKIEVNGKVQESIRLVYAGNDLLYVNINSLNRISKITGKDGTEPKLSKLGSDVWEKLKKNTKKKVKDIARDLIKLYAKRKAQKGTAFAPDSYLQTELEASFIYEDTPDQERVTSEVKKDMESPHPMDRLVCGDVGFGKTEIAVRAAFKAVADGKQVAILVPTTILAMQHHKTFKERLKDFPCTVDYVNRFKSSAEIKSTLEKVKNGKVDILIGTHRLVSKDVKFKDLGLLIIDEEQKFGVSTKEKLKEFRVNVDTLTLTATPIPRTLHFSLMGARDLSVINTPPPNRQPVITELHVFNEKLIRDAINFELERGGQVFFVHNRVQDIYQIAGMLQGLCPDARVAVGHGQLPGGDLEDVMIKFVSGDADILVATTIIESGLDISNANTIIINHAHMFGLSDLHQMRGRVGRSNQKAFCYLLSPPLSTLTNEARKRLQAIEEFSDLGSGFNVAMRDLDIRGAGNLLGGEQSGFIAEIGFDMYHKILDEAIQELKEEEFKDVFKDEAPRPFINFCQLETDMEIMIPDEYVQSIQERLNLYSELNNFTKEDELEKFSKQLVDRFGPIPNPVIELMDAVQLQWKGKALGFEKIVLKKNTMRAYFISNPGSKFYETDGFQKILGYAQSNPRTCRIKEGKSTLFIGIDNVQRIKQAMDILNNIDIKN